MKITICGLFLASTVMTTSCAQAIARHDVFERSDNRIERAVETARRTCQEQQPKTGPPLSQEYERCALEALRRAEFTVASTVGTGDSNTIGVQVPASVPPSLTVY